MSTYVLNELLVNGLELVYAAHHQGAAQAETSLQSSTLPALKSTLQDGAKTNREQAQRLEKVFKRLKLTPHGTPDQVMQSIIDTNNTLVGRTANPTERDLINIAAGQHAAHFYLASYGALRHYARLLGHSKVADLLQQTLDETGAFNMKLTKLAHTVADDSQKRTSLPKEGGLLLTTIPAFIAVGLVGAAITVTAQSQTQAKAPAPPQH